MPDNTLFKDELLAGLQTPGTNEAAMKVAVKNLAGINDNFDTVRITTSTSSVRASVAKVAGFTAVAAGTVTIYANTAQSGTTVWTGTVTAGQIVTLPAPVVAALGVSVTLAGGAQIDLMVA